MDTDPYPTPDTFENATPTLLTPSYATITDDTYWETANTTPTHVHHHIATTYPDVASTGLFQQANAYTDYNAEMRATSLLYAGAIPNHTMRAIRTYLTKFATDQTTYLSRHTATKDTNTHFSSNRNHTTSPPLHGGITLTSTTM